MSANPHRSVRQKEAMTHGLNLAQAVHRMNYITRQFRGINVDSVTADDISGWHARALDPEEPR